MTIQAKTLVLFDFDGTLTKGDTLSRFLLFSLPINQLVIGTFVLVFRFLGIFLSGKWSNEKGKEALFSTFYKGQSFEVLQQLGTSFCQQQLPQFLRPELLAQMREYHQTGATVVLVSASLDIWLRPFCREEGIQLICTELEFANHHFSGKFATPNCSGPEKARRIKTALDLSSFQKIIAFGNSKNDTEMLALADEAWLVRRVNHTFATQINKTTP